MTTRPRKHRASFDKKEPSVSTDAARELLQAALQLRNGRADTLDLGLLKSLLQRCRELDALRSEASKENSLAEQFLLSSTNDSGYTPLHEAVYNGDLVRILLLLRLATTWAEERMLRRPMELLHLTNHSFPLMRAMAKAVDHEGMTPAALIAALQRRELAACRVALTARTAAAMPQRRREGRSRSNSLFEELADETNGDEQNEFDLLSRTLRRSQQQCDDSSRDSTAASDGFSTDDDASQKVTYGCEVFTFGRAHHCALGVVASDRRSKEATGGATENTKLHQQQLRPQRVQAFAQDTVGRAGSAVAVASAAHHTLTVTAAGELYAFGLGKGGRLGTGDEKPCATPVRVQGPLLREVVVGVAAAENHSLCVTEKGHVYAFGSNRFGQLGTTNPKLNADETALRCLPRRVDDLKHVMCVSVAAGARHSVALSTYGEVFVWGDNSAGQLGISGRSSGSNNPRKVQRVESLWKAAHVPKITIAIAASEQSTLVLTSNSGQRGLPVNSVYSWGHGNHVPCKAQFGSGSGSRAINPIAISCARYHNVAVTSEGDVYSWGLHADTLGTSGRSGRDRIPSDPEKSGAFAGTFTACLSAPQLVTGMLPKNGGGKVVAVSASENHTAVITEDGHLWTWGDTYKQNILGHEGVRWQPEPKRVPAVHRAVSVSAAKEHTVLLIGASFPPLPPCIPAIPGSSVSSLETLVAQKIAQHCDVFNVLPIMITAERTQTPLILEYCKEFVRLNLDCILNVGQKSAMDCYLNEQLDGCSFERLEEGTHQDERRNPFMTDVVQAGSDKNLSFRQERLCSVDDWLQACKGLSRQGLAASIVARCRVQTLRVIEPQNPTSRETRTRLRSQSFSDNYAFSETIDRTRTRKNSLCSERCDELILDMNLSSIELAEAKLACLTKEVRAIRKRLSQIAKLESCGESVAHLTREQERKIARRAQLEAELLKFKQAVETVESKLRNLYFIETEKGIGKKLKEDDVSENMSRNQTFDNESLKEKDVVHVDNDAALLPMLLRCEICQITCPDEKSHELHMNGRKHRNKMTQVSDVEKKQAAADMLEEQQRQLLLMRTGQSPATKSEAVISPWDLCRQSFNPKYTLPPPPHPTTDPIASSFLTAGNPTASTSLRKIMEEESRRTKTFQASSTPMKKPLQLPPGSALPTKSPPWSTSKVHVSLVSTSLSPIPSVAVTPPPQKLGHSLGDYFIEQPVPKVASTRPAVESTVVLTRPPAWWNRAMVLDGPKQVLSGISLLDIQEEEQEFKSKQDQTYGTNGKWFIGQRERAGSFKEIQGETAKEVEERLFIKEQMRIEKQIYEELAEKKAANAKQSEHRSRKKRSSFKNGNTHGRSLDNHDVNKSSEHDDVIKAKSQPRKRPGFKAETKESNRNLTSSG